MLNIFVGCSSRNVYDPSFNRVADEIGGYIASRGHNLVFGDCDTGLMGKIYYKVIGHGKVIGVQAKVYEGMGDEIKTDEKYVLSTINQRKDKVFEISDVLVYMFGGIGTLDELISAIEARRSGEHDKPIIIINEKGFFNRILNQLETFYNIGLASPETKNLYYVASSIEEAIQALDAIDSK